MQIREARVLHRPAPGYDYLPEGPRALPDGKLAWITIQRGADATAGALHLLDLATGRNRTFDLPGRPGFALATGEPHVFRLGIERQIGLYDVVSGTFRPILADCDTHCTGTILNDAEPCRDGLIFGLKDSAFREHKAGLYFLRAADGELFVLRTDRLCSNGKVVRELGPGKVELFDIDSPTRIVRRYELDTRTGTLDGERTAIDLRTERGVPDGMCGIPGTADVVIAMFDPEPAGFGRALRCSLRDGSIGAEYRTPGAAQVTCPAVLPDGRIVLTTAAEHLSPERLRQQPNAGCLFVVEP
jgi:sugar lactone lactonase YvrE